MEGTDAKSRLERKERERGSGVGVCSAHFEVRGATGVGIRLAGKQAKDVLVADINARRWG